MVKGIFKRFSKPEQTVSEYGQSAVDRIRLAFLATNKGLDKSSLDDKDLEVSCRMSLAKMMMAQAEKYYLSRGFTREEWETVNKMTDANARLALLDVFGPDAFNMHEETTDKQYIKPEVEHKAVQINCDEEIAEYKNVNDVVEG